MSLSATIQKPIIDGLALLLLSRPVICFEGAMVLEFCGVFWVMIESSADISFFATEAEAIEHVQSLLLPLVETT